MGRVTEFYQAGQKKRGHAPISQQFSANAPIGKGR
jgi:hypothetical protein